MNRQPLTIIARGMLIVVLLGAILPAQNPVSAAPPARGVLSASIPLLKMVSAWMARNRTYESVDQFVNDYTKDNDKHRETLRTQFKAYVHALTTGASDVPKINPLRDNQVAAYVIVAQLLDLQRQQVMDFAEKQKKAARKDFTQALKAEILDRVMATGMVQQVFGAITGGLGGMQTMLDSFILKQKDQKPFLDLELRQLRTLTDQLRFAAGILNGREIGILADKLQNLSKKITDYVGTGKGGSIDLSMGELDDARKEVAGLKARLKALAANRDLPDFDQESLTNLGMGILGTDNLSPANQAILQLLADRGGKSYEEIRAGGLALIAIGDKARCQEKAEAILKALQQLAKEQGQEIVIEPREKLCNEISADKLLGPPPEKTSQSGVSTDNPDGNPFDEESCACGDFTVVSAQAADNGLMCRYEWTGDSGVKSELSFTVDLYYEQHLDDFTPGYQQELDSAKSILKDPQPDQKSDIVVNGANNFAAVVTGPGGTSETGKPLPMCGRGNGVYIESSNYLISTRMFSCDLGDATSNYVETMETLAACAMQSIDNRFPLNAAP